MASSEVLAKRRVFCGWFFLRQSGLRFCEGKGVSCRNQTFFLFKSLLKCHFCGFQNRAFRWEEFLARGKRSEVCGTFCITESQRSSRQCLWLRVGGWGQKDANPNGNHRFWVFFYGFFKGFLGFFLRFWCSFSFYQ